MIAAARFQKAQMQLTSSRPYALKIEHLLSDMFEKTESHKARHHPFLVGGVSSKEGVLIITSEKGLCGVYNTSILKKALEYIKTKSISDLEIFVVGKKGRDYFKRNGIVISREYFDVFKNFSSVKAKIIADEIIKLFLELKLRRFSVIYAEYKSLFYQPTRVIQLFPVGKENTEQTRNSFDPVPCEVPFQSRVMSAVNKFDYIYEPSREIIVDKLLYRYIKSEVFKILIEAYTAEVASRRNTMENATKNSAEIISELSLVMNNLRQQQITTELTEIVGAIG